MEEVNKKNILIFGSKGQLGLSLQAKASLINKDHKFVFFDSLEADITDKKVIEKWFTKYKPNYCINAAAYTAVDSAEKEKEKVFEINKKGVENLAWCCKKHDTICIHISTDFVFEGNLARPLTEKDETKPINTYGASKLAGEKILKEICQKYIIIRTSWLFSEYGNNFLKTMSKLSLQNKKINVVNDQIGIPTYALDLATIIYKVITENIPFGTYHFSNEGVASWYDFAYEVFKFNKRQNNLFPIPAIDYPTPAKRPSFTVLNNQKLKNSLEVSIPHWKESVKNCLDKLK